MRVIRTACLHVCSDGASIFHSEIDFALTKKKTRYGALRIVKGRIRRTMTRRNEPAAPIAKSLAKALVRRVVQPSAGIQPALGLLLIVAVSCGPTNPNESESFGSEAFAASATAKSCDDVILEDHHTFQFIGTNVTLRLCKPFGLELPTIITTDDATGQQTDYGSLLDADRVAYH